MSYDNSVPEVDCIIKIGGAAITIKDQFETLNEVVLENVASQVRHMYADKLRLIVVHGAGSFGHFQAAEDGIVGGGVPTASLSATLKGFAKTRLSVTKLNHLVVSALVRCGIPAVGVSPLGSWTTDNRKIATDGCFHIAALLSHGYVPVIHGDAVIDSALKCTVLGGDPIVTRLCQYFRPRVGAVFMTNVLGIYDKPPGTGVGNISTYTGPDTSEPKLLRDIIVDERTRTWTATYLMNRKIIYSIETSALEHDSTGGINAKVAEAVEIVIGGTRVRVVKAGTEAAWQACTIDELHEVVPNWLGTEVILQM
jgi:isopentenyl phosphate kinase